MFSYLETRSSLSDLNFVGERAWIGDACPDESLVQVNLLERPGFRATPSETSRFGSIWIMQEPVLEQGWRILLDSCIRMLTASGILVVRYIQNQYISIPALKNFLYRKYGIQVSVCAELIENGEFVTAFHIEREVSTLPHSKTWTFGILTQGKKAEVVEQFCKSVRQYGGDTHEILIVGPKNSTYEAYSPTYIEKAYSSKFSDICVKKNDIVDLAKHENICIVHDRYWLDENFFSGFEQFGYDFDFLTIQQHHQSGKNYPSYCAIDDRCSLIWGTIYECGNENQTWNRHYLNGGLIVAKRALLKKVPLNPLIFHNQAEDVELAKQMAAHSVVPRINRLSSATTDVPDYLTDAFTYAPTTDYDQVFFPPPAVVPEAPADVNPRPWGRLQGLVNRIDRRRREGATWKGIIFSGTQFAVKRVFKKVRAAKGLEKGVLAPISSMGLLRNARPKRQPAETEGLNIILYASEPGGVVNLTIYYMRSLVRRGIPFCIVDIQRGEAGSAIPQDLAPYIKADPFYPTNVWCIGFPFMSHHLDVLGAWAENRWNTNFTHWELPHVPKRLKGNFDGLDSIIVTTEFVRDAIAEISDKPIALVDPEINIPLAALEQYNRQYFGLPKEKVLFLLNWEFMSSTIRKNPEAGLRAFDEAFVGQDNVALVMHVKFEHKHGDEKRREYEAFLAKVKHDYPQVIVLEKNSFSYEEALGLKRACDCYISLHRSEGYGMGCAEALALGRRCVMTGWSGNMELMKNAQWRDRAYTVTAALVPVTPADYPWVDAEDEVLQLWADVHHEDAVRQIRRAYEAINTIQGLT
jgi:hypothetical protein